MSLSTHPMLIEAEDYLKFHPASRAMIARLQSLKGTVASDRGNQSIARYIQQLCSIARLYPDAKRGPIERKIREQIDRLDVSQIDWKEFYPEVDSARIPKAVVLKPWVSPREKGVVYMSFEYSWIRLLLCDTASFAQRYTIVTQPSWNPPHSLAAYAFPRAYPDSYFTGISGADDLRIFPRFSPKIVPVPLMASNWVDSTRFRLRPHAQRDIDIVMVATFGKYKRHHALFRALQRMPRTILVRLLGTAAKPWTSETIREMARTYGVEDRLIDVGSAPYQETLDTLCRARISLILSRREGSCVAVAESLFADTPVGMLENAEVGSRAFINDRTGKLLRESHLAEDIMDLLAHHDRYSPRAWAEENGVSCHHSTRVLNDSIKQRMLGAGQEWTQDLAVHGWVYDPELLCAEDKARLKPACEDIRRRFGLEIGREIGRDTA